MSVHIEVKLLAGNLKELALHHQHLARLAGVARDGDIQGFELESLTAVIEDAKRVTTEAIDRVIRIEEELSPKEPTT